MKTIRPNELTRYSQARAACAVLASTGLFFAIGCAATPNQWREDGPAATQTWNSPTAAVIASDHQPAAQRQRDWDAMTIADAGGQVTHWPLYFEDPFVDKGHGRTGMNKYHLGWEDLLAGPYGYARHTLNWMFWPVSGIVTPPCRLMESDGELSEQLLGYDHDAERSQYNMNDLPPDKL